MSRSPRRVASVAVAALAIAASITGCGAGFDATTSRSYAPSNGSVASIGDIRIRNVVLVQSVDGRLTEVYAAFVNDGNAADQLTGIRIATAGEVKLPSGPVTVPAMGGVNLGPSGTRVFADGLTLVLGHVYTITLSLAHAGEAHLSALVMTSDSLVNGG